MKILLVNYRYFVSGGPERYLFNVTDLLESHGHTVMPFSVRYDQNEPTPFESYFVSPIGGSSEVYFKQHGGRAGTLRKSLERAFYSREAYDALAKMIEREQPDVALVLHYLRKLSPSVIRCLHDHDVPFAVRLSDFGMICPNAHLLRAGAPCELCVQGSLLNSVRHRCVQGSLGASIVNYAATQLHRRAGWFDVIPRFLVPSRFTIEKMRAAGWDGARLVHLPTFVRPDPEPPAAPADPPVVAYVGRLDETKGLDVLLEAVRVLRRRPGAPPYTLHVVGDGDADYTARLEAFAKEHGLSEVRFDGARSFDEVQQLLRTAVCSVVPSIWYENVPNSALESLAVGTPVVASGHGSLPEIVEPCATGWLFEPGSAELLADALFEALTDVGNRATMRYSARDFVSRHHSPEQHYESLMGIFDDLLAQRGLTATV